MKKILALAGSNSSTSINHQLVLAVASHLEGHSVKVIRLTDYELPMFGEDLEREQGFSESLKSLLSEIEHVDGLIISVNEHNGSVSAFFKNVLDWLSRIEYKFLENKKILLCSASTGKRGALSAFEYTQSVLPRYGGEVVYGFNFPNFSDNFSSEKGIIIDPELNKKAMEGVKVLLSELD
ncbi:MAG: NAD(P)H-dependent oxidoreductase [Flavobacteriaceae bacterium]|nr:NAD(P)H-dependent oxidoreductase [Flavobacteriaceae bacterium]